MLPSVDYKGHTINAEDLKASEAKVKGVVNAPAPQDIIEIRSFLNYYSKFLPDLSFTLAPLYSLLRKQMRWS